MPTEGLKPEVIIQNVVASVTIDQEIDLKDILERFPHTEYDPKRFPGLIYKLKTPKAAVLIFASGKMVVTGARAEREVYVVVEKVIKDLRRGKILKRPKVEVKIQNVVASGNLFRRIDLEKAALMLDFSMYEPDEFPGLMYKMDGSNIAFLLFASGKIVCTGATRESDVFEAVRSLRDELEEKGLFL